jgi:hypothetical protein
LFGKDPNTSIIATLDEQGKLILPQGEAFTPDSSVRINIVETDTITTNNFNGFKL